MNHALRIERDAQLTWLTLNRPSRLNALDLDLRNAISEAFAQAAADDSTRVLVLTGAGDRAFCAGQDLNESQALGNARERGWIESWSRLFEAFLGFPKPIVTALNGVTAGGGFEMALFSDIRIARAGATLIMAEVDVGLPAMTGSAWLSAHVFDSRMLEIVLTGRPVCAEEALRIGLVHEVVAPHALEQRAREMACSLAAKPPRALDLTMRGFRELRRHQLRGSRLMEEMPRYQAEAMDSGVPQRIMQDFIAEREARKRGMP